MLPGAPVSNPSVCLPLGLAPGIEAPRRVYGSHCGFQVCAAQVGARRQVVDCWAVCRIMNNCLVVEPLPRRKSVEHPGVIPHSFLKTSWTPKGPLFSCLYPFVLGQRQKKGVLCRSRMFRETGFSGMASDRREAFPRGFPLKRGSDPRAPRVNAPSPYLFGWKRIGWT